MLTTSKTVTPLRAKPPVATASGGSRPPACLTVREVAAELRASERQVWRWIASGELPHIRSGRFVRVTRADLDAFIARLRQALYVAPPSSVSQPK